LASSSLLWLRLDVLTDLLNRVPELYATEKDANSDTNTYQAVPSDHRFYYFLDRAANGVPVSAFPEGLKMLVGNQSAKSYQETGLPPTALI
jgi:hypothetical protein